MFLLLLFAQLTVLPSNPLQPLTKHHIAPGPTLSASPVSIGGCPVAPADSVLVQPITNLPVHTNSAQWLSEITGYRVGAEPSFTHNMIVGSTYATYTQKYYYGAAPVDGFPLLSWPNKKRENGWMSSPSDGADHHMLSVVLDKCQFYESYNDMVSPSYTTSCQDGSLGCNATSGETYASTDYEIVANTDAAGLPQWLVPRLDEIKGGAIHHPTRFTLARGFIQAYWSGTPSLWPAGSNNNGWGDAGTLPYGARLRLRADYDISGYSPYAQTLLQSFKDYGLILADVGTTGAIQTDQDVWTDPAVINAVYEATGGLSFADFDVVDESSLQVQAGSVKAAVTVNPVTPIGVGLMNPQASALVTGKSYVYNFGADAWVTNTTNKDIMWSLVSGPGTVNELTGEYTVPATVAGVTSVTLRAQAAVNLNVEAYQYILLYPVSADSNFRTALAGQYTDDSGYTWYQAAGLETGIMARIGGDWPAWTSLNGSSERAVYQSVGYTYGADLHWRLIAPNGSYNIRFMFGNLWNGCYPGDSWCDVMNPIYNSPFVMGVNDDLISTDFAYGSYINWQMATPYDLVDPVTVSNNVLDIWIGRNNPDGSSNTDSPSNNGLEIEPVATASTSRSHGHSANDE